MPTTFFQAVRTFLLAHNSPRVLVAAAVAGVVWRAMLGSAGWSDLVAALVIWALWPLQEWLIHTRILHFRPRQIGRWRLDMHVAREHRRHHEDPRDLQAVFIPFATLLRTLVAYAVIGLALRPEAPWFATGVAAYLVLSLHYEWVHFVAHVPYTPPLKYYARVKRFHTLHHHKNAHYWWGVSRTAADWLLGTSPDPSQVEIDRSVI